MSAQLRIIVKVTTNIYQYTNIVVQGYSTTQTAQTIPTQDRIQVLARWLDVSPSWLRFGDDEIDGRRKSKDMTAQEWRLVKGFRLLRCSSRDLT